MKVRAQVWTLRVGRWFGVSGSETFEDEEFSAPRARHAARHDPEPDEPGGPGGEPEIADDRLVPFPVVPGPPQLGEVSTMSRDAWRLPIKPAQPGIAADEGRLGSVTVRAASVVGPGHRTDSTPLPRQDAYRLGRSTDGEYLIAAIADGMSDSTHSDLGATLAVTTVVSHVRDLLDAKKDLTELDGAEIFTHVARTMVHAAEQRSLGAGDVRSTLAVLVIAARPGAEGKHSGWIATVGDSAVWQRTESGWEVITGDAKDPEAGSGLSSFLPHYPSDAAGYLFGAPGSTVLALLTDGVSDAFHKVPGAEQWFCERWAKPMPAVSLLLDVSYEARTAQDDRTAVVVWLAPEPRSSADGAR